jgi:hypothetical protein
MIRAARASALVFLKAGRISISFALSVPRISESFQGSVGSPRSSSGSAGEEQQLSGSIADWTGIFVLRIEAFADWQRWIYFFPWPFSFSWSLLVPR